MDNVPVGRTRQWWELHDNIVQLTAFMAENRAPASEVARAVEKPWNYTLEFQASEAQHQAELREDEARMRGGS